MELYILLLPLIASTVSGFFGRYIGDRNSEIVTSLLVSISAFISLMVFYVYAMQCMATLAVVKRETKGWKWPLIQMGFMGVLAYIAAYAAFNIFS